MVATFNDFIFLNPVGSKGVVKTEFGYHYIEILSQKGTARLIKLLTCQQKLLPARKQITMQ